MSWITFIWSLTAGICLTLGAVHFLIWARQRDQWANLVFSISAAAAAGYAVLDMIVLRAHTPAEYGELSRWTLLLGMLEGVSVAWFIRLYLRAGRLWLLWLICGLRALMLGLNFVPGPNFIFREITGLQPVPLLGELISRPQGVLYPWAILLQLSLLLILLFVIDAAHTASRRGERRRAWVLGGLTSVGFALAMVSYALYVQGILPSPFSGQLMLLLILVMGYELSLDVLRAGQLSRELLESQQRVRLAASAADLSLWEWDILRDGIWTTEKGRERAGIGASERINLARFLEAVHPEDREPTQRAVRHALEVSGEYEAEYRVTDGEGATHWVMARGHVEHDAQGKPLRLRGVSVDVTARKQAEAELRRLQGELAHVSRVSTMGQLASSLAHELNQPLGAILRNAEAAELFLQEGNPDLEEIRAILADIRQDDQRAGAVIDRMRAMLKRRESQAAPLDLNALVSEVAALVRLDAEARKTQLALAPATPVPPVWADRVQLQQVVLNLLLNAMEAMSGCPPPERHVSVSVCGVAAGVEVAVSDAGPGISAEHLQRVFDPFFTTKPGGLGMGLAISRSIISAHGGRLTAENNGTGGATFRLTLPLASKRSGGC